MAAWVLFACRKPKVPQQCSPSDSIVTFEGSLHATHSRERAFGTDDGLDGLQQVDACRDAANRTGGNDFIDPCRCGACVVARIGPVGASGVERRLVTGVVSERSVACRENRPRARGRVTMFAASERNRTHLDDWQELWFDNVLTELARVDTADSKAP